MTSEASGILGPGLTKRPPDHLASLEGLGVSSALVPNGLVTYIENLLFGGGRLGFSLALARGAGRLAYDMTANRVPSSIGRTIRRSLDSVGHVSSDDFPASLSREPAP